MPTSRSTIGTIGRNSRWVRKNSFFAGVLPTEMRDDAGGAGAFHARKIAPQCAKFLLFRVKLLGGRGGGW